MDLVLKILVNLNFKVVLKRFFKNCLYIFVQRTFKTDINIIHLPVYLDMPPTKTVEAVDAAL